MFICAEPSRAPGGHGQHDHPCLGELTSTTVSPMVGMPIGLALLSAGRARHRERLFAVSPLMGRQVEIEIRSPVFFDPDGERLHA